MPTRNVNLTDHYNHFVESLIASGASRTPAKLCAQDSVSLSGSRRRTRKS